MTAAAAAHVFYSSIHIQLAYVRTATTTTNCPYGVCATLVESISIVQFRVLGNAGHVLLAQH